MNHHPGRQDEDGAPAGGSAPAPPYGPGQGDHPGEPVPDPDDRDGEPEPDSPD